MKIFEAALEYSYQIKQIPYSHPRMKQANKYYLIQLSKPNQFSNLSTKVKYKLNYSKQYYLLFDQISNYVILRVTTHYNAYN